jgi:predicted nucleic-acid-binding protein
MIGLDTNVLVRYLVEDEDPQKRAADRFVEEALSRGESLFVNQIVLCEVVWVLSRAYGFTRREVGEALEMILCARQFEIEAKDMVVQGLREYRKGKADFADCVIGLRNQAAGCTATVTFDRKAASLGSFQALP